MSLDRVQDIGDRLNGVNEQLAASFPDRPHQLQPLVLPQPSQT